jgi:signal transduction histidine kinase
MWKALPAQLPGDHTPDRQPRPPALPVLLVAYLPGLAALSVGLMAAVLGTPLGAPWLWAAALGVGVLLICLALVLVRRDRDGLRRDRDELARRLTETELHRTEFVAELLVNLARRSQGMVYRQLEILGRLQAAERDQDTLADLFALDHLATRVRRTAENLLVLAGAQAPRTAVTSAPLREVVRSGITETEDLERVLFIVEEQQRVAGHAAADLAHLLSELVENAVRFSPPDSVVTVRSSRSDQSGRGRLLTVEDWGVGIPPEATAEANTLMAEPREVDLSVSQRLGLHVVARLAQRHGIQVTLGPGLSGGTVCSLNLPAALFEAGGSPDPERDGVTAAIPLDQADTDVTATQRIPTIPRAAAGSAPTRSNPTGDELFGSGSAAAAPTGSRVGSASPTGTPATDRARVAKPDPARTGSGSSDRPPAVGRAPADPRTTDSWTTGPAEPRATGRATKPADPRTATPKTPEAAPPSRPATTSGAPDPAPADDPADPRPDSAAPAPAEPDRNRPAAARPQTADPGSTPSSGRYSNERDRTAASRPAATAGPSVFTPGSTPDNSPNPPPTGSDPEATTTIRVPTARSAEPQRAARSDAFDPAAVPRQAGPPSPADDVGQPDVLPHRAPRRRASTGPQPGPFGSTGRWEGWWESQEGHPSPVSATAPSSTEPWPVVSVPADNALPTRPRPPAAAPPGPARAEARRSAAAPVAWVDPTPADHSRPDGRGLFDIPSPTEPPPGESVGESRAGLHRRVPQANLAPELRDPALDEPAEPPASSSISAAALSRYQASREAARIAVSEEGPTAQGRSGATAGPVARREDATSSAERYESGRSGESVPQTDSDRSQPADPPEVRHDGEGDRRSTAPDAAPRTGSAGAPDPVDPPTGPDPAGPEAAEPDPTTRDGDGAWSGDNRAMHPDPGDRTTHDAEPGGDR